MVFVGYLLFIFFGTAHALVPVEGLLMGEVQESYQQDPLLYVFRDIYDKSQTAENKKLKLYYGMISSGILLDEECSLYGEPVYQSSWQEKQAKRSVVATLQYIGLDASIKAIGAYAKKMDISSENYQILKKNLVNNFCSKNTTVISLRNIEQSLQHYYEDPLESFVPTVESSGFASQAFKEKSGTSQARSNELDQAIRNFRAFCSWGGDVSDYRMLAPYLNNKFIMAFITKSLTQVQDTLDEKTLKVVPQKNSQTLQVMCQDLICRKVDPSEFSARFPLSIGSTGLRTDLSKLYCHHFRYQNYNASSPVPQVKTWIKEADLEDPILETGHFLSLMTGVPEVLLGLENYQEIPYISKSSIDERWNKWSRETLKFFSHDLLFEESLKVKALPERSIASLRLNGFHLDFTVTMGEMDRLMDEHDKLGLTFDLKFSKNFLRQIKGRWISLSNEVDTEGQKAMKKELAERIALQLKDKEKKFTQKMWNEDFSRLLGDELLEQVLAYEGPLFDSYREQMLIVPVKFSYGLFALSYLRYRGDINAGRLKLNL